MVLIFIDHTTETYRAAGGRAYYVPTLRDVGLCSAAEFFFFLSGYVFALAHDRLLNRIGIAASLRKSYKRLLQIYIGNIVIFASAAIVVLSCSSLPASYMQFSDLWFLQDHPLHATWAFLAFGYFPAYTDILPLYVLLLAVAPFILLALRKVSVLAILLSAILYGAANILSQLNLSTISGESSHWGLNPFAWQFLFVTGMALGSRVNQQGLGMTGRIEVGRPIFLGICFILIAIALTEVVFDVAKIAGKGEWVASMRAFTLPGLSMTNAGPLRLAYFAMLLVVLLHALPPSAWFETAKWAKPVVACGQRSLTIFVFGAALTQFIALSMLAIVQNYAMFLLFIAASVAAMLGFGMLLSRPR